MVVLSMGCNDQASKTRNSKRIIIFAEAKKLSIVLIVDRAK